MKRLSVISAALLLAILPASGKYNDYRGHNVDSLERVVAKWTPEKVARASQAELVELNNNYRNLMLGYNQLNGVKSDYYARKALEISDSQGWYYASQDAYRYIGLHFYATEQYDSARFYYGKALECVSKIETGATSFTNPDGYTEREIDDAKSALYGTIGNLYNMQDSLDQAMEYYAKAGEIFEKWGWNESNSILWYNIGETWVDAGAPKKAEPAYKKALEYALAAGDSLMIAQAYKGFGNLYQSQGRTVKALRYLKKADSYFKNHKQEEIVFREETMDYSAQALRQQRTRLLVGLAVVVALLITGAVITLAKRRVSGRPQTAEDVSTPGHGQGEGPGGSKLSQSDGADDAGRGRSERSERSSSAAWGRPETPKLNDREIAILKLLAQGCTNSQIADQIFLSPETVKWYRKNLLLKFDAANSAELIFRAKELGLL
ncbi:MAG: tetratricopeptide repeat protein [Fretibacterium sp.]|nr:tetratricopeptide repeat protein [Bacteroidales bacterium]MBQ9527828.1 tetratricopeptide repeat protein [Fretibacterium sp.]